MGTREQPPETPQPEGWNPEVAESALQDYAVIGMDPERKIIHWNKGAEQTFGYREAEVLGQPLEIIFTPEDLAAKADDQEFERAIRTGSADDERWHVRKDGSRIWVTGKLRALHAQGGGLEGFTKVVRDTTARKLAGIEREAMLEGERSARAAAESSWKQLEEIFENAPALIALIRLPQQTYLFANRMLREYVQQETLAGRNIREAHPDIDESYFRLIDSVAQSGRPYTAAEFQIPLRPGSGRPESPYFNLAIQRMHSKAGECEALLVFAADVSSLVRARRESERLANELQAEAAERKRAEELAKRQAKTLSEQAALLDLAQDAITVSRLDGTIMFWNRGAEQLFGWTKEEALGKNIHELLHTDSVVPLEDILSILFTKGQWTGDIRHTTRHGDVVLDLSRWVLRRENGHPAGWLQIDRDVTESRRTQTLLTERQRLESLGVLAGGVAHDFNNLLTGILGNITLARDIAPPDQRLQELLARSEESSERAADLVRQILAYTGKGQFTVEPVDVSRAVRHIVGLLRSTIRSDIAIHLELGERLPPIQCDATQLKQVAMNLVLNAVESIYGPGTIVVRTGMQEVGASGKEEQWDIGDPEPGAYAALTVEDTGAGIDPAIRARIFEPFFTTKFAGRGLGLAAVAGIVRRLKGAARIASAPGQGTTITVLCPVGVGASPQAAGAQATILVVDDDQTGRETAAAVLANRGYGVLLAGSGREALDVFRRENGRVAAVLLDMIMPGLSGAETFRELKKLEPGLRVIVLTGYPEEQAAPNFGGLGVAAFIGKPYTSRHLVEVVRRVLQS